MNAQTVADLVRQALMAAFWVSLPLLLVGFLAGVLISLLQIVTSIQDPAFAAAPRLAAFLAGAILFLPWILLRLVSYTTALLGDLPKYAR